MTAKDRLHITIEEFEHFANLPENADRLLELFHGEITEKVPTEEHGVIVLWIAFYLNMYLKENPIGLLSTEARHRLHGSDQSSLLPDISFIKGKRYPVKRGSIPQMPDLAIEIRPPDDTHQKMQEKANYYLANGSQMVWLVDSDKQQIEVYALAKNTATLKSGDVLNGGEILPGFTMPIKEIFDKIKP